MDAVKVEGLVVSYDGYTALEGVTFSMPHPSITVILGPNGAGKTTLIKAIMGIIKPRSGRVEVFGKDPIRDRAEVRKMVSYVPQRESMNFAVPLRVRDILATALIMKKGPLSFLTRGEVRRMREVMRVVNLPEDSWNKLFSELSGGQQQKVLLARALLLNPKLLVLDEPFSGIDVVSQREIMTFLHRLRGKGISTLMVLHDANPFLEMIDYMLILNRRLIGFGRPEEVLTEEILKMAYGEEIKVIRHGGLCYAIIGDKHA